MDFRRLGHATWPKFTAGHVALIGADKDDTVALKGGEVSLGGRMIPHAYIHGRGHEDRLVGSQQNRRCEVIGQTLGGLGHEVSGGWGDNHKISGPGQLDMTHFSFIRQAEKVRMDRVFRQGREGQGGDKLCPCRGQNDPNICPRLSEKSNEFKALIGGDPATDNQEYAHLRHGNRTSAKTSAF